MGLLEQFLGDSVVATLDRPAPVTNKPSDIADRTAPVADRRTTPQRRSLLSQFLDEDLAPTITERKQTEPVSLPGLETPKSGGTEQEVFTRSEEARAILGEEPTFIDTVLNSIDRVREAAGQGVAAIPKAVALAAQQIDRLFGNDKDLKEYVTWRLGETLSDFVAEKFPRDPRIDATFVNETLPQAAGSTAPFFVGGFTAKALKASTGIAVALQGAALGGVQGFEEAKRFGANDKEAEQSAGWNALLGLSEAVPIGKLLNRFDKASGGTFKKQIVAGLRSGLFGSIEEGAQELFQQVGGNVVAKAIYDKERGLVDGVLESTGAGGVVGFVANLIATLVGGRRARRAPRNVTPVAIPPAPAAEDAVVDAAITSPEVQVPSETVPPTPPRPQLQPLLPGNIPTAEWVEQFKAEHPALADKIAAIQGDSVSRKDIAKVTGGVTPSAGRDLLRSATTPEARTALRDQLKGQTNDVTQTRTQEVVAPEEVLTDQGQARTEEGGQAPQGEVAPATPEQIVEAEPTPQEPVAAEPVDIVPDKQAPLSPALAAETAAEISKQDPIVVEPSKPDDETSLKNAVANDERIARGKEPLEPGRGLTAEEALDIGVQQLERNPQAGRLLVQTAIQHPRILDNKEGPLLLAHKREIKNEYDRVLTELVEAQNRGDSARQALLTAESILLDEHLDEIDAISKFGGTQWSDSGRIRQMMLREDFTLATVVRQMRSATGLELSAEELKAISEDVTKRENTERLYTEAQVEERVRQATERTAASLKEVQATSAAPRKRTKRHTAALAKVEDAWRNLLLNTSGKLFSVGGQLEAVPDLVELAKAYIELGVVKLADFLTEVRKRVGKERTDNANDALVQAHSTAIEDARPQPRKVLNDREAVSRYARELAEFFVSTGTSEREQLVDQIHGELEKVIPGITREQSRDAFDRYGQYRLLDSDEVKVKVRQLSGESLQVSKLRDLKAGKAPLATGQERPTPGAEERRLTKQVNEMKKKGGFVTQGSAATLKSTLASIETRLTNQITDLEFEIETRQKIVRKKGVIPTNEKIETLTKRRDELRKTRNEIFGKTGLTDAQRIKIAEVAANRSFQEFQRRIDAGEFGPRPKKTGVRETASLKEARAQRDAKKAEFELLKDLANPKKDPDEVATARLDDSLKRRLADRLQQLATGNFEKKPRKVTKPSADTERLRFENEQAASAIKDRIEAARLKNRSAIRKVADVSVDVTFNLTRAVMFGPEFSFVSIQGGTFLFRHPIKASRVFERAVRAMATEAGRSKAAHELSQRKNFKNGFYKRARLEFSETSGPLRAQEEFVMSSLTDKIPILKNFNRAWVTYMNLLRAEYFDMMTNLGHGGTVSEAEAKVLANAINIATGRGNFGKFNGAMTLLNSVFLAPKYKVSRFQLLAGPLSGFRFGKGATARTRKLIAKEYGMTLAGVGAFLGLASMALTAYYGPPGEDKKWDMNFNPLSRKFGLRIGTRTLDPFFGIRQVTMFVARSVAILAGKGKQVGLKHPGFTLGGFFRNLLAPIPSAITSRYLGTTPESRKGRKVPATLKNLGKTLITPVSYKDVYESMIGAGVPAEKALGLLNIFGGNVRTEPNSRRRLVIPGAS